MCSKFIASVLSGIGIDVRRIRGGYKSYRKMVNTYLDRDQLPHQTLVLHGLTGVGKTHILMLSIKFIILLIHYLDTIRLGGDQIGNWQHS